MIRNGPDTQSYSNSKSNHKYQSLNLEIEVQNVNSKESNSKFAEANSPRPVKGDNMIESTDDAARMFTEFDEERSNFFDSPNFENGPSRNSGQMSPIEELS